MKEAFKKFINDHPFLTFFGALSIVGSIVDAIVGIARAITGKYPPAPQPIAAESAESETESPDPVEEPMVDPEPVEADSEG